ncbi:uncharacterized protein LOC118427379 isoform X1 [Branchiostoma floridae]|uniref:Uncharacterized protein LOC118427379 isoform X1 n=1 Tax=Branchiostoma floridae TaxID=7739 RepID=A0A9J7N7S9_BRAFL|nr:uncharacterized protein LOC118427379 isoform X1 [Branchiostoma floridae]
MPHFICTSYRKRQLDIYTRRSDRRTTGKMKVSTMSALLLALVCCALLVEDATAADLSELKTKADLRDYMKNADDKDAAVQEIYDLLVSQGKEKFAEKFMKKAQAYISRLGAEEEEYEEEDYY